MISYSQPTTRPANVGTSHNLPQDIRDMSGLRDEVIAWTSLDPAHARDISSIVFCQTCCPLLLLPCFWPHLIILSPCLCSGLSATKNAIFSTYWILTETELKIVIKSHDRCCFPNCVKSGNILKTIPLENITDSGLVSKATGCVVGCTGDVPSIYIDTASSNGQAHEATALALAGQEWFIREILNRRDIVKQGRGMVAGVALPIDTSSYFAAPTLVPTAIAMERGGTNPRSAEERIKELANLREGGFLTNEQYEKKKQEIIDSI
jgi:hypothetical protein